MVEIQPTELLTLITDGLTQPARLVLNGINISTIDAETLTVPEKDGLIRVLCLQGIILLNKGILTELVDNTNTIKGIDNFILQYIILGLDDLISQCQNIGTDSLWHIRESLKGTTDTHVRGPTLIGIHTMRTVKALE